MGNVKEIIQEKVTEINIPIGEEDIRMFQELVDGFRNSVEWRFDGVDVIFSSELKKFKGVPTEYFDSWKKVKGIK